MSIEQQPENTEHPESKAGTDHPRLRLRSLVVHEFRDVKPGTKLEFGDGFHLVLGKNATGKSTLLQLIAAISGLDFTAPFFSETPFHLEARLTIGKLSLDIELRRKFLQSSMQSLDGKRIDVDSGKDATLLVKVEHRESQFCKWVQAGTGEKTRIYSEDPSNSEAAKASELFPVDPLATNIAAMIVNACAVFVDGDVRIHPDAREAFHWIMNHPGTQAPFDESVGALNGLVDRALSLLLVKGFLYPCAWLPESLEFNGSGEPVTLELSKDPILAIVIRKLGFDEAKAYFGPGAKVNVGWRYSAPSFQFFRGGEAIRRHDQLSFGQQRLFSFAWYLACNRDIAVADELVNGLHAEWIDWCIDALRDRQSFLTSQNPILVDSIPFTSKDEIQRGIILCESVPVEGGSPQLVWRQLGDREADLIARAFQQSRLDLLSDLLHALDLW